MTSDKAKIPLNDNCPSWAHIQLNKLKAVEVSLGNIPPSHDYNTNSVNTMLEQLSQKDGVGGFNSELADLLFSKIVSGLNAEGHEVKQIVTYVNNRVRYEDGPPYCNEEEVIEAIRTLPSS